MASPDERFPGTERVNILHFTTRGGREKYDFQKKKTGRGIQTFNVKLGSVSDTWSFDVFFVF